VFPVHIAPLRERPADIVEIAIDLVDKHSKSIAPTADIPELDSSAIEKLKAHSWPGNVRELDNVIQRALILRTGDSVTANDIQYEPDMPQTVAVAVTVTSEEQSGTSQPNLGEDIKNHEYKRIIEALRSEMGNRKAVADKLGISQRTLRYKLAKMRESGIDIPGRYGTANA
jgi:two-component system response regulator FlrC